MDYSQLCSSALLHHGLLPNILLNYLFICQICLTNTILTIFMGALWAQLAGAATRVLHVWRLETGLVNMAHDHVTGIGALPPAWGSALGQGQGVLVLSGIFIYIVHVQRAARSWVGLDPVSPPIRRTCGICCGVHHGGAVSLCSFTCVSASTLSFYGQV